MEKCKTKINNRFKPIQKINSKNVVLCWILGGIPSKKSVQNAGKAVEDTLENIKTERECKNRKRAIEEKYKEKQKQRKKQMEQFANKK